MDHAEHLEEAIPTHTYHSMPIVGLGGSAGSLAPLQEFFRHMPAEPAMAFVVVLHLSPVHESSLAEILQRCTSMPVLQVSERTQLALNRVYVMPPGKQLVIDDGHVTVHEIERERGSARRSIFFPHARRHPRGQCDRDCALGRRFRRHDWHKKNR